MTAAPVIDRSTRLDRYISFRVGRQLLGVPVEAVQEVLAPQSIAPVPLAEPEIAGLLNLRGQIVTALDLRTRLGLEDDGPREQKMNVVCRFHEESYSLLVDEIGDVIDKPPETLEAVPYNLDSRWKQVTRGVYRLEGELFVILDVAATFGLA